MNYRRSDEKDLKKNCHHSSGVVTALTAALQVSLWTMKKIDQSDKFVQEKMENTGINPVLAELKSWFLPMQKIEKSLKNGIMTD